jgi:hypothetical protein
VQQPDGHSLRALPSAIQELVATMESWEKLVPEKMRGLLRRVGEHLAEVVFREDLDSEIPGLLELASRVFPGEHVRCFRAYRTG